MFGSHVLHTERGKKVLGKKSCPRAFSRGIKNSCMTDINFKIMDPQFLKYQMFMISLEWNKPVIVI